MKFGREMSTSEKTIRNLVIVGSMREDSAHHAIG
jgi:hypothetical protein